MSVSIKLWAVVILTLIVGMILEVIPLPQWAVWGRPTWVFLIILFWVTLAPHRFGIVFAWIVGIFVDLLTGTILGQHAFIYTAIAFLIIKFHPQFQKFPLWQQSLMIFIFSMLNLALSNWIMDLTGNSVQTWAFWWPALSNMIIWPWINILLKDYESKLQVYS